jgi:hypothetical protein
LFSRKPSSSKPMNINPLLLPTNHPLYKQALANDRAEVRTQLERIVKNLSNEKLIGLLKALKARQLIPANFHIYNTLPQNQRNRVIQTFKNHPNINFSYTLRLLQPNSVQYV